MLRRFLWPHGVVLAAFGGFVAWNGGVVLGEFSIITILYLTKLIYRRRQIKPRCYDTSRAATLYMAFLRLLLRASFHSPAPKPGNYDVSDDSI